MSALIVGASLASGQKVLRKSQSSSEVDGLVTITETYAIRTEDAGILEPDRNTSYNAFTGTTKYSRMLVETTRVEPMDGGIANLVVNYVGLDYASGLPPAYITVVGQPGVGVFGVTELVSGSTQAMCRHPSASNAGGYSIKSKSNFPNTSLVVKICTRRSAQSICPV
jgi:hypothetical protein